jgi:2,3-dihydroxybenzoate-AMP ligase
LLDGCTPWPASFAERYRQRGYWRGEHFGDLLRSAADRFEEKTALVHRHRRLSYAELDMLADRMAAGFVRHGITAGDRIVVQLPNVPEFIVVCFALFRLGAKPVFALTAHRASEIKHLCELSGAVGYVHPGVHRGFDHPTLARKICSEVKTLRLLFVLGNSEKDCVPLSDLDDEPVPLPDADATDVAFFLLSGGTTALPKLIGRTHDDYAYQSRTAAEICGLATDDVYLVVLPVEFNFVWGCPGVVGTLQMGGKVVLVDDPTADDCFAAIERERVTITSVVPTVAQLWLESVGWTSADLSSLRTLQIGGAKLQPSVAEQIEPAFACALQQVFGMAEGLLTLTRAGDPKNTVIGTQGRPLSLADEIKIVDANGSKVSPGKIGELLTRGPYTVRGYYRAREHNARVFTDDGFYRSGDLARLTADGNLVIEGRIKDVVIRGGYKISADEIEGHLLEHPAIAGAAVIGIPDELLGERICAYLIPNGKPPALAEVKRALHERGLAAYKLPDRVVLVDSFPLTGLGKVDKKALARLADSASRQLLIQPRG